VFFFFRVHDVGSRKTQQDSLGNSAVLIYSTMLVEDDAHDPGNPAQCLPQMIELLPFRNLGTTSSLEVQ